MIGCSHFMADALLPKTLLNMVRKRTAPDALPAIMTEPIADVEPKAVAREARALDERRAFSLRIMNVWLPPRLLVQPLVVPACTFRNQFKI
ncbi:MAG: hypothetical protein BGP16_07010 [Sphingobium sp. 66-54]|nr:MAG: hypothetical protein BGP16_07010 [Sphingobium sp. 66-54]